jgi:hypothetical protein
MSAADGSYSLSVATGKVSVSATLAGYLSWQRTVPVGGAAVATAIRLVSTGVPEMIGSAGGTVAAGPASVVFPSGAVASATQVTATWLPRTQVSSFPSAPRWVDASGHFHRTHSVLHLSLAAQLGMQVTVTIPVPADAVAAKFGLSILGADGSWGTPLQPTQLSGGMATFILTTLAARTHHPKATDGSDSDLGGDEDTGGDDTGISEGDEDDEGNDGSGSSDSSEQQTTYTDATTNQPVTITNGDLVPTNQPLIAATNERIVDAYSEFDVVGEFVAGFSVVGTESVLWLRSAYGQIRSLVHQIPGDNYAPVQMQNALMGVRGTAFTVDVKPCPPDSTGVIEHEGSLEVTEGIVAANKPDGESWTVNGGQSLTISCLECGLGGHGGCCLCPDGSQCPNGELQQCCLCPNGQSCPNHDVTQCCICPDGSSCPNGQSAQCQACNIQITTCGAGAPCCPGSGCREGSTGGASITCTCVSGTLQCN